MFIDHIFEITVILIFLIILYRGFCRKPKIKVVKAPTVKQIRKEKKRARRIRKISRRFKVPYVGKTEIIQYDKTSPCIDSMWEEIQRKK